MGFYLHIEVESTLSPSEFHERVIIPLGEALDREGLGRLLASEPDNDPPEGAYELALEVTDQERAGEVVEQVVNAVDS